ncbi:MAG TPA: NAD-binding protein, partial [Chloroflexota bacterium]|nr:NAD-binding protein [Chloroflexota bacterium]
MPDSGRRPGQSERVAVIGLGRFGTSVAKTLHELGYEVTAIDRGEKQIQEAADFVTLAVQGDG